MTPIALNRLFWGLVAIVGVSVGLAARQLPWRFAGESGVASAALPAGAPELVSVSLDPIFALMPFGSITAPAAPSSDASGNDLGLTLHGLVIAATSEGSIAIVAGASGPASAYGVGDAIGAATLAEIHDDHVVLETSGRRSTLAFPKLGGDAAVDGGVAAVEDDEDDAGAAATLGAAGGDGLDALRALATAQSDEPEDPAPDRAEVGDAAPADEDATEAAIADIRERLRDDPQQVLDDLGLEGGDAGYEVGAGAAAEVLRAGLEPGDLVAKVNGQQVGNIEQDRRFFDEVAVSDRARLEVVRNGQHIVMSFPLR